MTICASRATTLPRGAIYHPAAGPLMIVITPYDVARRADEWCGVTEAGIGLLVLPAGEVPTPSALVGVLTHAADLPGVTECWAAGLGAEAGPWRDLPAGVTRIIWQQPQLGGTSRLDVGVPTLVLGSWFCTSAPQALALGAAGATVVMGPWVNEHEQHVHERCHHRIDPEEVPDPLALALAWAAGEDVTRSTFVRGVNRWEPWRPPSCTKAVVHPCRTIRPGVHHCAGAAWSGAATLNVGTDDTPHRVVVEEIARDGIAVRVAEGIGTGCVTLPPLAYRTPAGARLRILTEPPATKLELRIVPAPPGPSEPTGGLRDLVDERTGILTEVVKITHWEGLPPTAQITSGQVSDVQGLFGWPADRLSMGMAHDADSAWRAAVGEAIERYCGNAVPPLLRRTSYDCLIAGGELAVDPAQLALFDADQLNDPGCPFVPFTRRLSVDWTPGRCLRTGGTVWVPAALTWVNFFAVREEEHPPIAPPNLAGLAAGRDLQDAERAALEEIIERDAAEIWWACGAGAKVVTDADQALKLEGLVGTADGWWERCSGGTSWRLRVLALPSRWDVPVIGVLLHDRLLDLWGLGLAARPDATQAVDKAALEAISLRAYAMGLLEPDGDVWLAAQTGAFDGAALHPHRPDRAYLDDYRADFRDVTDLACHAQLWLDPRMKQWLTPMAGPLEPTQLRELPHVPGPAREGYLQRCEQLEMRPVSVDLTTPDVAATGPARVVRVIVPGAYSNTPAGYRLKGGRRLYADPISLGLRSRFGPADVVPAPMPHT